MYNYNHVIFPYLVNSSSSCWRAHPSCVGCPTTATMKVTPSVSTGKPKLQVHTSHKLEFSLKFYLFILTVLREKMDYITLLSDVVLPVLHEVLQCYQWIFHYWHHIFRGPGLHGDQYNPCVELFLIDLRTTKCPSVHMLHLVFWCHFL